MASEPVPLPPRQGDIWWSVAPPSAPGADDADLQIIFGISEEQLSDWLSCTTGWKALELTWGALASCEVSYHQLKPLLQAAMAEAARLGAAQLVVRQLDVDEVLGRCLGLALTGFPNFTALKLRELNLYDEAMGRLSDALHSAEHLQRLVLDTVWASVGGWSALGAAIKVNNSLTTLRVRHCLGDAAALGALCSALADQHGSLEVLRLSHNGLGDSGVEELCKALSRSYSQPATRPSRVSHLDLSHNQAGRQCVPTVGVAIRTVRALRHLDLSYNDLGAEAVRELCVALSYAPHITSLNLVATGADDSAVEALTRGSLAPPNPLTVAASGLSGGGGGVGGALSTLCLGHNRISARGAVQLAAAVRRPGCPLTELDLGWNALVGEEGAKAWAEVLAAPPSAPGGGGCRLRRLVLSGCEVTDAAAFALGAALKTNVSLQELGLAENHISTRGLALLAEVLKVNSSLRLLDVSLNMVGPQGMSPFTRMSHLRGHVVLGKGDDHAVQRVSSCLVKAELLREYREVEAVKNSRQPWEAEQQALEEQRRRLATYHNPFLDPATAAAVAAAAATSAAASGPGHPGHGAGYNPFLSPSATYTNPFLDATGGDAGGGGGGGGGGHSNPFSEAEVPAAAAAASNPFLTAGAPSGGGSVPPQPPENPFLSTPPPPQPAAAVGEAAGNPFLAAAGVGKGGVEGRDLATRVLIRLGTDVSASAASAPGSAGGDDEHGTRYLEDDGRRGSGSDIGTEVYVSSRSTADEADLVTDLDLRLVDYMLENLGVGPSDTSPPTGPKAGTAAAASTSGHGDGDGSANGYGGSSSSGIAVSADPNDPRVAAAATAGTATAGGGWGTWGGGGGGGGRSDPSATSQDSRGPREQQQQDENPFGTGYSSDIQHAPPYTPSYTRPSGGGGHQSGAGTGVGACAGAAASQLGADIDRFFEGSGSEAEPEGAPARRPPHNPFL